MIRFKKRMISMTLLSLLVFFVSMPALSVYAEDKAGTVD